MPVERAQSDVFPAGVANEADVCDFTPTNMPVELIELDGSVLGDLDGDCDVDLRDFQILQLRYTAPN